MKTLTYLFCLMLCTGTASAGWFSGPDYTPYYQQEIESRDQQLAAQGTRLHRWQIATGSLACACVLLLLIGTALGAQTRKHYDANARRMGHSPTPSPNGRKPNLGEAPETKPPPAMAA